MARVFITGSSDGLGLAAARLLASEQHEVVGHARNEQRASDLRDAAPRVAHVTIGDLSSAAETRSVAEQANALGRFDAVIHNAGVGYREPRDLIAQSGGTVTITPSTDMLMQFGTFPSTGPALSRGIAAGFGIDTICSAGTDLFSEMRLALAAERSRANAAAISADKMAPTVDLHQRDMLRLATLDGARVWGLQDEIGTLTPGKQADIAVIDLRSPHLDGFGDPVAVMVLGAGPADVETVIVGGDIVNRDGKLTGDRAAQAQELMHATRRRLRA